MRRMVAALGVTSLALALQLASPSYADTRSQVDNEDYDVVHKDIDIHKVKVTYNGKGVTGVVTMKPTFHKGKRLRILMAFITKPTDDIYAPEEGNFVEFRLDGRSRKKVVNWEFEEETDGYFNRRCKGIKVKVDYDKDTLTYKVPKRCANFQWSRKYVDTYVSARRYTKAHWDTGTPDLSTGDWFDTTYDLAVKR